MKRETANVRLSVVIPFYNTPVVWQERCLQSVLQNLGTNDEVICIDDASTMDMDFLMTLQQRDLRVRYVKLLKNKGLSNARNVGMELARGRYLAFVDSDDEVLSGIYDQCIAKLESVVADVVVYGVRVVWPDDGLFKEDIPSLATVSPLSAVQLWKMRKECLFNFAWNKVFRRDFLINKKILFVEKAMPREDVIFNLDCVIHDAIWCAVPQLGYVYNHTHSSSLARFQRYAEVSCRFGNKAWKQVWEKFDNPEDLCQYGIMTEHQLQMDQWKNLWRRDSPCSLRERWQWLKENDVPRRTILFVKTLIFSILRRWCYIRLIRRWHVRRMYPQVQEYLPMS